MKSIIFYLLILSIPFTPLTGQWKVVHEGYHFRLVDFVSKDVGWMITEDTILKTIDGGETWIPDPWHLQEGYHGCKYIEVMDFVNDSVGWISMPVNPMGGPGEYGLFKTTDSGKNWELCAEESGLELVYATEDLVIVSMNAGSNLSKSRDGGITWLDISPDVHVWDPTSMSFIGSDTGIYTTAGGSSKGTEFNRTFNGGKTWQHRTLLQFDHISEIGFIDNLNGYFVAERISDQYEYPTHVLCKTEDAFETWEIVKENDYKFPISCCYFLDKDTCIALIDDSLGCNILKSCDGGQTWVESAFTRLPWGNPRDYPRYEINFNKASAGFIYSSNCYDGYEPRLLLKSIDRGDSWVMLNLSYPFNDVRFANAEKGFVVGGLPGGTSNFGDIFKTTDGGRSWDIQMSSLCALVNLDFLDDSTGFAAYNNCGICYDGRYVTNIFHTPDGGSSWNEYTHKFNQYTGLNFLNEYVGFAGNDSGIYMTYDGGGTWEMLFSSEITRGIIENSWYIRKFITTIVSSDENTYWAIAGDAYGDEYAIMFTSEGTWEKIELETDQSLYKIFFRDEHTGWIATGEYWYGPGPPILFKTEDGGESWFRIDNPYHFRDIYFKDMYYGWAIGMDSLGQGVILETTNGGQDWTVQVESLSAPLNGIDYNDDIAWAVGGNGLILKMNDSTNITAIEDPNSAIEGNSLLQLYPNPTNSILHIETEISGQYSIELLDLNGRMLLKKVLTETNHQLDLSSFGEGVYFITIRSKDFVTTKKVLRL